MNFPYSNGKKWSDSILYVALILRPNMSSPAMIPLFEEKELDSLFAFSNSDEQMVQRLYGTRMDHPSNWKSLYSLLWKKIEPQLKGVRKVYYSPSGMLNRISFAALPINDTLLLTDKYEMVSGEQYP